MLVNFLKQQLWDTPQKVLLGLGDSKERMFVSKIAKEKGIIAFYDGDHIAANLRAALVYGKTENHTKKIYAAELAQRIVQQTINLTLKPSAQWHPDAVAATFGVQTKLHSKETIVYETPCPQSEPLQFIEVVEGKGFDKMYSSQKRSTEDILRLAVLQSFHNMLNPTSDISNLIKRKVRL